jgi:hypothetical protein
MAGEDANSAIALDDDGEVFPAIVDAEGVAETAEPSPPDMSHVSRKQSTVAGDRWVYFDSLPVVTARALGLVQYAHKQPVFACDFQTFSERLPAISTFSEFCVWSQRRSARTTGAVSSQAICGCL